MFVKHRPILYCQRETAPPTESTATQTIATIAFGVTATLIRVFTTWQGRRAWRKLYRQESERNAESNIESRDYSVHGWPKKCLLISASSQLRTRSKSIFPCLRASGKPFFQKSQKGETSGSASSLYCIDRDYIFASLVFSASKGLGEEIEGPADFVH